VAAGGRTDPAAAIELIRGLHPLDPRGVRRAGNGPAAVGWPPIELRVVSRDGVVTWQIDCPPQLVASIEVAARPLYPGLDLRRVKRVDSPPTATAIGRALAANHWPLRRTEVAEGGVIHRLAGAFERLPGGVEGRLRLLVKPMPPLAWQREITPPSEIRSRSIASIIGEALIDGFLFRQSDTPAGPVRIEVPPDVRDAYAEKREGDVGFEVGMLLEIAGTDAATAQQHLWRLKTFSDSVATAQQRIGWDIRAGTITRPPRARLADWELAQLWYLPDGGFDRLELPRARGLVAPPPPRIATGGIRIGEARNGPLTLSPDQLSQHMAVFGATGSGKSTLLLSLALGLLETPVGATIIDPHGDLAADLLSRIPPRHAGRVHVLRLAEKAHPRGFNFLERRDADDAQLVTSEFVELFEDLWPKFCGPKMQHYLRQGLLTLLAHPEPQTVIELVRVLTDDAFRDRYLDHVDDPMLTAFWQTEWPGPRERDRDTSIKAVLNKLGAFVSYGSIRQVVGQGVSTLRPRELMDNGDLLVVDLSRVGGDNAQLFGAMLISRYYVDALGRQGTAIASRRPHLLIADEAQRFSTRAVEKISIEGRKFGLRLCLATQSLATLPPRLRSTILTNVATMALLSPGAEDVRDLARLFDRVPVEELHRLRRFELVLRMLDGEGRPSVFGGMVTRLAEGDPATAASIVAASDARDARPVHIVRDEIRRRAGAEPAPAASATAPNGKAPANGRRSRRRRNHARGPLKA